MRRRGSAGAEVGVQPRGECRRCGWDTDPRSRARPEEASLAMPLGSHAGWPCNRWRDRRAIAPLAQTQTPHGAKLPGCSLTQYQLVRGLAHPVSVRLLAGDVAEILTRLVGSWIPCAVTDHSSVVPVEPAGATALREPIESTQKRLHLITTSCPCHKSSSTGFLFHSHYIT